MNAVKILNLTIKFRIEFYSIELCFDYLNYKQFNSFSFLFNQVYANLNSNTKNRIIQSSMDSIHMRSFLRSKSPSYNKRIIKFKNNKILIFIYLHFFTVYTIPTSSAAKLLICKYPFFELTVACSWPLVVLQNLLL